MSEVRGTLHTTDLPAVLYRVVWDEGRGYPVCTHHVRKKANFASAGDAARQVRAILKWPSHHKLVGVFAAEVKWVEVAIPLPKEEDDDSDTSGDG